MIKRIKPYLGRMGKAAFVWCAFIGIWIHIILICAALVPIITGKAGIMPDVNTVQLAGNLEDDPTEHRSDSGLAIAGMSVATNHSWKDKKTGEWQKRTEWHRVSAFGKRAEWCLKELKKGRRVWVEGRLQTDVVEDKYGQKRYYTKIIAQEIGLE